MLYKKIRNKSKQVEFLPKQD